MSLLRARSDWLLALAAAAIAVIEIATTDRVDEARGLAVAVGLIVTLPLAWRRRYPLEVLAVIMVALPLGGLFWEVFADGAFLGIPLIGGIYSAARHEAGGRRLVAAAVLTAAFAAKVAVEEGVGSVSDAVGNLIFAGVLFGLPFVAGRLVRSRQLHAEATEAGAEDRARAAAADERARIARELHDVVGHSLSVIAVQAGVERKLQADRGTPSETLETIEQTAREALGEMRRLLGMLRRDDREIALAPQPSLAEIDHLIGQVRAAGLPVELEVSGDAVPLSPGVDLSAYRIVQEALTNALKHAGPARARVRITYEGQAVVLEVEDDGAAEVPAGAGHGLVGMQERVSLYGGDLRAGRREEGGFAIRARLPTTA